MTKLFGIGLHKTGTSTLEACLETLGYSHNHNSRSLLEDYRLRNDFTRIHERIEKYDSFSDWPWPLIYREIDEAYPDSKFILTLRKDTDTWFESLRKHALSTRPLRSCRKLVYGYHYPQNNEAHHRAFYENHNREVREYFRDRPDDLLELCWERGDGWEELCSFLGEDVPNRPVPERNTSEDREVSWTRKTANQIAMTFFG